MYKNIGITIDMRCSVFYDYHLVVALIVHILFWLSYCANQRLK